MAITTNGAAGATLAVSADLAATISDESGTGALVFATSPTLTSPVLTTPSISNINAAGDLIVGTADNTIGIISIGANATVLTSNGTTATWVVPAAGTTANDQAFAFAVQVFA